MVHVNFVLINQLIIGLFGTRQLCPNQSTYRFVRYTPIFFQINQLIGRLVHAYFVLINQLIGSFGTCPLCPNQSTYRSSGTRLFFQINQLIGSSGTRLFFPNQSTYRFVWYTLLCPNQSTYMFVLYKPTFS